MKLISRARSIAHQALLLGTWFLVRPLLKRRPSEQLSDALVIPCDPHAVIGSRGDEAMLEVALEAAQSFGTRVVLGVSGRSGKRVADLYNVGSVDLSQSPLMPIAFAWLASRNRFGRAFVMGADMMDGHYSPVVSLRLIIMADILSRVGCDARFLGFSFNGAPSRSVVVALSRLERRVKINLRDSLSFERYRHRVGRGARLVSDSAFLLKPESGLGVNHAAQWVASERERGQVLVGVNLHQLLFSEESRDDNSRVLLGLVAKLLESDRYQHVSWVLIPHDDRIVGGDVPALNEVVKTLESTDAHASIFMLKHVPRAKEIKYLVSMLDGVLAARMHLAIAALGSGVPAIVFKYQDKFDGLLLDFGLPADFAIDPSHAISDELCLETTFGQFVSSLEQSRGIVGRALPVIQKRAKRTFEESADEI